MNLLITLNLPDGTQGFVIVLDVETVMPARGIGMRSFLIFESHDRAVMTSVPESMIENIELTTPHLR